MGCRKGSSAKATAQGGYLAFLGRICPDKGPVEAIEIARQAGMQLKIAAKVDPVDQAYFDEVIAPLLAKSPHVEFIGEIHDGQKQEFLGNARALLFPIHWPEPFGLVMIEAMACGTPVIAFRCGSVPEVLEDGLTGFVVERCGRRRLQAVRPAGPACSAPRSARVSRNASAPAPWRGNICRIYRRLIGAGREDRRRRAA